MISPNRQPIFESKFAEIIGTFEIELATAPFFATERNHIIVAEAEKLREVIPHHDASERRG